jgi:hypothetical protein
VDTLKSEPEIQSILSSEALVTFEIHLVLAKVQRSARHRALLHSPSPRPERMIHFVDIIGHVDVEVRQGLFPHWEDKGLEYASNALLGCVWDFCQFGRLSRYKEPTELSAAAESAIVRYEFM